MRLVTQRVFGGPEVLELVQADRPEPVPTEALVRVHAAGINPVDWKSRSEEAYLGRPPYTVGWDVAGVVEEIGMGVTGVAIGDEVLGMPWFPREAAAYADHVTGPSHQFVRKPATMSFAEAAGLPLAGLTAWQGLVDVADVGPGQRVLVDAAAGGVGHLAVQIAKARVPTCWAPRATETTTSCGRSAWTSRSTTTIPLPIRVSWTSCSA